MIKDITVSFVERMQSHIP